MTIKTWIGDRVIDEYTDALTFLDDERWKATGDRTSVHANAIREYVASLQAELEAAWGALPPDGAISSMRCSEHGEQTKWACPSCFDLAARDVALLSEGNAKLEVLLDKAERDLDVALTAAEKAIECGNKAAIGWETNMRERDALVEALREIDGKGTINGRVRVLVAAALAPYRSGAQNTGEAAELPVSGDERG